MSNFVPQNAAAQLGARQASGSNGDLLYIQELTGADLQELTGADLDILTYPQGQLVGTATLPRSINAACSDSQGHVWAVSASIVYELAHAGTLPIASLSIPDKMTGFGCAVDQKTRDLALATDSYTSGSAIYIWRRAKGSPMKYVMPFAVRKVTYDNASNLFFDGRSTSGVVLLGEIAKGGGITTFTLDKPDVGAGTIQWDGKELAVAAIGKGLGDRVYQVRIKGSEGLVSRILHFHGMNTNGEFYVYGDTLFASSTEGPSSATNLWHYPKGGQPYATDFAYTSTVMAMSVAPR